MIKLSHTLKLDFLHSWIKLETFWTHVDMWTCYLWRGIIFIEKRNEQKTKQKNLKIQTRIRVNLRVTYYDFSTSFLVQCYLLLSVTPSGHIDDTACRGCLAFIKYAVIKIRWTRNVYDVLFHSPSKTASYIEEKRNV